MENAAKRSRILGGAFLFQFVTSFTSMAVFLPLATGVPGLSSQVDIGRTMVQLAANPTFVSLNILGELLTALGVLFLGALLWRQLRGTHEALAMTAFGLYVVEGTLLAVGRIILYALLVLSQQYVAAGNAVELETTGLLLYEAMSYGSTILNLLFCLGATIFYALLLRARTVPRLLSWWGLISVQGVFVGALMNLFDVNPPLFLFLAYVPFELVIGVWILVKGTPEENR